MPKGPRRAQTRIRKSARNARSALADNPITEATKKCSSSGSSSPSSPFLRLHLDAEHPTTARLTNSAVVHPKRASQNRFAHLPSSPFRHPLLTIVVVSAVCPPAGTLYVHIQFLPYPRFHIASKSFYALPSQTPLSAVTDRSRFGCGSVVYLVSGRTSTSRQNQICPRVCPFLAQTSPILETDETSIVSESFIFGHVCDAFRSVFVFALFRRPID
ncbi:hypothetical protein L596_012714 [Steinernema carpocapsae]|uniref:Uncharacterized protein n=1 Tax=Steinernema carpocapsae TaxID=34508 RepID=A0A4U5NYK0_STECR|nr:hypothetical protein L596_012714 [Steinernema carpocapsae]